MEISNLYVESQLHWCLQVVIASTWKLISSFWLYFMSSNTDDDSLRDEPWSQRVEEWKPNGNPQSAYIKRIQQILALLMGVFRSVWSKGVGTNLHMYDLLVCFLVDWSGTASTCTGRSLLCKHLKPKVQSVCFGIVETLFDWRGETRWSLSLENHQRRLCVPAFSSIEGCMLLVYTTWCKHLAPARKEKRTCHLPTIHLKALC